MIYFGLIVLVCIIFSGGCGVFSHLWYPVMNWSDSWRMVRDLNEFGVVVVNCSDKAENADHLTLGICLDLRGAPADGNGNCYIYIYVS